MASKFYMKTMFIFALAMMALAVFAGASSAASKTGIYVLSQKSLANTSEQFVQRPNGLVIPRASTKWWSPFELKNLKWQSWGSSSAIADGTVTVQGVSTQAQVRLSAPLKCGGYTIYSRAQLLSWNGHQQELNNKVHRIYRCELAFPMDVPSREYGSKPWYVNLTKKLRFDTFGWKGWGTKRTQVRRAKQYRICGLSCYKGGTRAKVVGTNIKFCRGTLMYATITARWGGHKKVVRLGKKWCRGA